MIVVDISEADFQRLKKEAEAKAFSWVNKTATLYDRFLVNKEKISDAEKTRKRVERAATGIIGELVFSEELKKKGHAFVTDTVEDNRNYDLFDFKIYNHCFDIKVGKYRQAPDSSYYFGYPVDQAKRHKDFVVVGWILKDESQVGFYGYLEHSRLK